jgi:hypothetical protein
MSVRKCLNVGICIIGLAITSASHAGQTAQTALTKAQIERSKGAAGPWMDAMYPAGRVYQAIKGQEASAWEVVPQTIRGNKVTVRVKTKDPFRRAIGKIAQGIGVVALGETAEQDTFQLKGHQPGLGQRGLAKLAKNESFMETLNSDYVKSAMAGAFTYVVPGHLGIQIPAEQASLMVVTAWNIAAGFKRTKKHQTQREALPQAIEAATKELLNTDPKIAGAVARAAAKRGVEPEAVLADMNATLTNNVLDVMKLKKDEVKE